MKSFILISGCGLHAAMAKSFCCGRSCSRKQPRRERLGPMIPGFSIFKQDTDGPLRSEDLIAITSDSTIELSFSPLSSKFPPVERDVAQLFQDTKQQMRSDGFFHRYTSQVQDLIDSLNVAIQREEILANKRVAEFEQQLAAFEREEERRQNSIFKGKPRGKPVDPSSEIKTVKSALADLGKIQEYLKDLLDLFANEGVHYFFKYHVHTHSDDTAGHLYKYGLGQNQKKTLHLRKKPLLIVVVDNKTNGYQMEDLIIYPAFLARKLTTVKRKMNLQQNDETAPVQKNGFGSQQLDDSQVELLQTIENVDQFLHHFAAKLVRYECALRKSAEVEY